MLNVLRPLYIIPALCGQHLCGEFLCGGFRNYVSVLARRDIAQRTIYRIRHGKQQQYDYYVPVNLRTWKQQVQRYKLQQAVISWHQLTSVKQKEWGKNVPAHKIMSGFNFYISEYIKVCGEGVIEVLSRTYVLVIPSTAPTVPASSETKVYTKSDKGYLNEITMKSDQADISLKIKVDDIVVFDQAIKWVWEDMTFAQQELDVGRLYVYRYNTGSNIFGIRIEFDNSYFADKVEVWWRNYQGSPILVNSQGTISYNKIL